MHRARLIRGLLGMAKALGTTLIAEGIEHDDEIDRIAALGLVRIQGYATGGRQRRAVRQAAGRPRGQRRRLRPAVRSAAAWSR